ncbi:MAG TPA: hypothetical protein VG602_06845, partial [Actinomycetota bacterium]|nr:hypothetical protein [Actinomycetota bacterium]
TRNVGVLLVLPLGVEAVHRFLKRKDASDLARGLVWAGLAAGGTIGYLIFAQVFFGDWQAPFVQQQNWQREPTFPLVTLYQGTQEAFRFIGVYPGGYHLLDWLIVIPALAAAIWVVMRARPAYSVYTVASLLAPLFYAFQPRPFMSVPRFLLPLFPLVWAVAVWAERRKGVHEAYLAVSATLLGVMLVLFVNWYYVF